MKLITLYHVFIHPTCHIPLFNFQNSKNKCVCVCVCIWKFLLKFDSGHAWTIFCGICKGLIPRILIGLCRYWFGIPNLNQLVLISKNWPNGPHFSCQTFVRVK
jgi:hypothetical protein